MIALNAERKDKFVEVWKENEDNKKFEYFL